MNFSLDIRAPLDETVEEVEKECRDAFEAIVRGEDVEGVNKDCAVSEKACTVDWQTDFTSSATHFHQDCIDCVAQTGRDLFGQDGIKEGMMSGAGHDSVYV